MGADSTASANSLASSASQWRPAVSGILRAVVRGLGFSLVLVLAVVDYARTLFFGRRLEPLSRRARWLHRWSRRSARLIGLQMHPRGTPPASGMIVSNHLGYLDFMAFISLVPCVFVAKKEVASWPVFGLFARMAGTIFVDRTQRMQVAHANRCIAEALSAGAVVVLFAEGTSSDGVTVLPFRTSLFEPATFSRCLVTPAAIRYRLDDGSVSEEVCYWRDMTLLPHLLNLFTKQAVRAEVAFGSGEAETLPSSRKDLARQLHLHVTDLRAALEDHRSV